MPILRKEGDFFPENLFDLPTAGAPWEIAHLRSRQEKAVARLLLDSEMPFYLPQIERKSKKNGRTFVSHLPLFPGYIFLRHVKGLRETLWRTSAVVTMMEVLDQEKLDTELAQIKRLQENGAVLTPREEFLPGDAVVIMEGVFAGYQGVIVEERGAMRLIVCVSILRKSIAVEFPREVIARTKRSERELEREREQHRERDRKRSH